MAAGAADLPIVSPRLIGREAALATLGRALTTVAAGQGQTVLLAGEAGIGKSRLTASIKARADAAGFRTFEGQCFEPDYALPYAPIADLLRTHLGGLSGPDAAAQLAAVGPDLAAIVPEFAAAAEAAGEPDRNRLLHGLLRYLDHLTAERPALVVVEDLHWSDAASLDLLHGLAGRIAARPILLLLTYRSDEIPDHLGHVLAAFDRRRLATELRLQPLSEADVAVMLRAIFGLGRPVRGDFVRAIYALTEGNPFFVEEIVRALVERGDIVRAEGGWERRPLDELRIPRSVRDAVQQRSAHLSQRARRVLALAAVAGRRFDFGLLQALTGETETALIDLLKELIAAQLIVEVAPDRLAFRHALTREAVAAELLARERRALHAQAGEAIELLYAGTIDAHLEDLAHHFFEAAAWDEVIAYGTRAGERALALAAPAAAAEQFARVLQAAEHAGKPPPLAAMRGRGLAAAVLGDFVEARARLEAALELAREANDDRGTWQALLDLGSLWAERDYDQTFRYLDEALPLSERLGDPAARAHTLNRMGNWYSNHEEPDPAIACHEEALAIFARLDDPAGIASTHDLLAMTVALAGDVTAAKAHADAAVHGFRFLGERQRLVDALLMSNAPAIYEMDVSVSRITVPGALATVEEAHDLARDIGWRSGEAYTAAIFGEVLGVAGEFGRGLALLEQGLAIAAEIEHHQWQVQARWGLGVLLFDLGAWEHARSHLEAALAIATRIRSRLWQNLVGSGLASTLIALGDLGGAQVVLDAAFLPERPVRTMSHRRLWSSWVELQLAHHPPDASAALAALDRLYAATPNLRDAGDVPRLAELNARALAAAGEEDQAIAMLDAARRTAESLGLRPTLARLQANLASLFYRTGQRVRAETEARAAHALIEEMAEAIPAGPLREGYLTMAIAQLPEPLRGQRRRTGDEPLTAREREIAGLIARGLTNREIAAALFIGERTVESHVRNALQKLGFVSRSQIAAWASEQGLLLPTNGT